MFGPTNGSVESFCRVTSERAGGSAFMVEEGLVGGVRVWGRTTKGLATMIAP